MEKDKFDKVSNLLILLSNSINNLFLTKAIKLMYLIDEIAVKETGVKVSWLDYRVWKMGPVPKDLYDSIRFGYRLFNFDLSEYLTIYREPNSKDPNQESYRILPIKVFSDEEFSHYEIDLISRVISIYGHLNAEKLIDILHEEGTLWSEAVKDNKLEETFKLENNTSNHTIDFSKLVHGDEIRELAYQSAFESHEFAAHL